MIPVMAPIVKIIIDPQNMAQAVFAAFSSAPTSKPVTKVGSEKATMAATAATRGQETSCFSFMAMTENSLVSSKTYFPCFGRAKAISAKLLFESICL